MLVVILFFSEHIALLFGVDPEDFDSPEANPTKEGRSSPYFDKIL
jgi:hypothetical protein